MKNYRLFITISLFITSAAFAQPSLIKMKSKLGIPGNVEAKGLQMTIIKTSQAGILFSPDASLMHDQLIGWLGNQLELRPGMDVLTPEGKPANTGELAVNKLHQYYKNIKVEHGVINSTSRNGKLMMMQMEFYPVADNFNITATLTEEQALQKAISFTGAKRYMWESKNEIDAAYMRPRGELVILQTYLEDDQLCLAYKFDIYASQPLSRAFVYVDAHTGRIVLDDNIIKHANITGNADTHYSGSQQIITNNGSGVTGKPYWLYQLRNSHEITTLNYNKQYPGVPGIVISKFADADNNWTATEYNNADGDDAALDVHFNMQIVSDYWKQVHNRNSWDDKNSQLLSYIHVNEYVEANNLAYNVAMDNAYWNGTEMYFGDGRNGAPLPPGDNSRKFNSVTSLDVSAHEVGHGICQTTAGLVYRWESGALNEGFSDIWGAAIENFGVFNNSSISPNKSTWIIAEEITINYLHGLRNMANPDSYEHPSVYHGPFWQPGNFQECRVPLSRENDDCGVHINSNVLNRWFYLITQGENGNNSMNVPFSVSGMGFNSSQKIAYLTELNLPPNSSFATARTVSVNAATTLYGAASFEVQSVKNAWLAVGVDTPNIYNMGNTPVFTSNNFISIAVGAKGNIWAGTPYQGLYQYNDTAWVKRPEIPNLRINNIKADKAGGIWIAQSGTQGGGTAAIAGGVNYFPNPYTNVNNFYTVSLQAQVPSRNARCIFVDTSRSNEGNPKVWVATQSYVNSDVTTSGMLGQGLYSTYKQFHPVSDSLNIASGNAGITTVGGDSSEVWGFAPANYGGNQLLSYNANTNAFIRSYDHNTVPLIPSSFTARSIYFDKMKRVWIGLASNGVLVYDEHKVWHYINFPSIFPVTGGVNPNAISGDPYGDVYIGTTTGLVFFDHGVGQTSRIDSIQYYHLYTDTNGLPSKNINAIAYDTMRFKLLVATDNGIAFWEPPCLGSSCENVRTNLSTQSSSLSSGNWSDPTIWSNGKIPDSLTYVTILYPVVVDINAKCRSLVVKEAGQVRVNTGLKLTVYDKPSNIIYGVRRRE